VIPASAEANRAVDAEIVQQARSILAEAASAGVTLRVLGGIAVHLHARADLPYCLRRTYQDIDVYTPRRSQAPVTALMERLGYRPDRHFNAAHGDRRLLFFDSQGRHIDVFAGVFQLCHTIPLDGRITADQLTVPLAELLLTKLQIVRLNEKDQRDILAVLHDHPVGDADDEQVNAGVIAGMLANDWGLWRTSTANLRATLDSIGRYELSARAQETLSERVRSLSVRIDAEPKSRRWRMRARVGERVRWYEEPEEEPTD
jgi:hypothetical protein